MKPAISQVCTLKSPFEKDIEDYAAGACRAVEIWLTKLEEYLEHHSVDDVRRLLERHEVVAPVASFQGGLLSTQGDPRRAHWEHFQRRLHLCRQLSIGTLVVVGDIHGSLGGQDIERVRTSLIQAAALGGEQGVRLAFEFQASATFANNLETAASLIAEVQSGQIGLCFDVFQYYLGPSKAEDLRYLSRDNLFHVHLADLADTPRELATDGHRILPGDGDFHLGAILDVLKGIGYDGYVSLELMNPQIWRIPARQLSEVGMTALRKLLGQASMD